MKHNPPIYKDYWISIIPYFSKYNQEVQSWEVLAVQNILTGQYHPHRGRFETYQDAFSGGVYAIEKKISEVKTSD